MAYYIKPFEQLDFTDNFMFVKTMENDPELCRELIELILQKEISRLEFTAYEKTIEFSPDTRGIRMDVYTRDDDQTVYDIEMQVVIQPDLAKRTRYYHSMSDIDNLRKNESYSNLGDAYVIFICKNRPREGFNLPVYTFRYQCQEQQDIFLEDGTWTILVNAQCDEEFVSDKMADFLRFIRTGETDDNSTDFTLRLKEAVNEGRKRIQWGEEYMKYEDQLRYTFREGKEEGLAEGLAEGRAEERKNTEAERARADAAEKELKRYRELYGALSSK